MQKLVSILTAIIMATGLIPIVGYAETSKDTENNLTMKSELAESSDNYTNDYFYEVQITELEKSKGNRFIVKYKNNSQKDKNSLKASAKQTFKELKKEKDKEREQLEAVLSKDSLEKLEQGSNKMKAIFAPTLVANTIMEENPEYEVIELADSINKERFVAQIKNTMGDAIEYIQPDIEMETSSVDTTDVVNAITNKNENLSQAHSISTGEGVTVALIDTGVDITHSDLQDNLISGWDFFNNGELVYSEEMSADAMHGTHIAGIISQVAPDTRIMPLKVFESGKAYTSDIIKAIAYAEENGADIVNCSWGNSAENPALKDAMENSNMFFVTATGNSRMNLDETPVYPASYGLDNIINVASVNQDGGMSYFSNYGDSVDIAAWGRDVYSTMPNNEHGNMNGTSMSAGYITGASALAVANGTNIDELKATLKSSADKASTLENRVDDKNIVDFSNIVYGITPQETTYITADDDFDRWTEKTPEENWELFSTKRNIQIVSDQYLSAVLKDDGTVWIWGMTNFTLPNNENNAYGTMMPHEITGLTNIKSIAVYGPNISALKEDGTVYSMGYNGYGELGDGTKVNRFIPTQVVGLTDIKFIALGSSCASAITNSGKVYAWGMSSLFPHSERPKEVKNLTNIKSMSIDSTHVALLTEDGTVYTWGSNSSGQLGNGTTTNSDVPIEVSGLPKITAIDTGYAYTVALTEEGKVYAWGNNGSGQLGNGTTTNSDVPIEVNGLPKITAIDTGYAYTVALTEEGKVYTWGDNSHGQLGNGTTTNSDVPIEVSGLPKVMAIAAGSSHTTVLTEDCEIYVWGSNQSGQLALGTTKENPVPTMVKGLEDIETIFACYDQAYAIKEDGTTYRWGKDIHNFPVKTGASGYIKSMSSSLSYTLTLGTNGTVSSSGSNYYNQHAICSLLHNITAIAAGGSHIVALNDEGKVYTGGANWYGQLGNGTFDTYDGLVEVSGLPKVTAIAGGHSHTVALTEDGKVYTWGKNEFAQLGDGTDENRNVPTEVSGLPKVTAIAAGDLHTVALTEEGTVYAWGSGAFSPFNVKDAFNVLDYSLPAQIEGLTNIKEIVSGPNHILALKEDGTVYSWGNNMWGEIGQILNVIYSGKPKINNISNVKSIAANGYYTMALKEDGTVWCWGSDEYGQLGDGYISYSSTPRKIDGDINVLYNNNIEDIPPIDDVYVLQGTETLDLPQKVQVTLDEGSAVSIPVQWDTDGYQPNQLGEQTIHGTLELPEGMTNTNNFEAEITVIVYLNKITSVVPTESIEVPYNTPAENLNALLPTQARVYLDNGSDDDFDITKWDKSEFKADVSGKYTVYGTIQLTDGIINPQGKKAEVTVKVGEKPPTTHSTIESIKPIQITADQSIPLEQEGLEHALGVPVTVPLPATVEAIFDDGTTTELNVTWDIASYNPHQTGKQTISGDVELRDNIKNPKNLPATLEITVTPTEYEIVEASPQKISVDVLAGTPKDKILEKIEQKTIDVDVLNAETSEEIYIYTGFTFSDEYAENLAYNPNQLGKQILIGRFYDNFLDTIEPPLVEVEVNVVSSEIASVTEEHVNAYQCMPFDSIENLPQKVTVSLENGMTAEVDVEWNSGNYAGSLAGDQIITGNLVNLPSGILQPEEEKTAVLIVHVQPVSYEVTAITPEEDFFETDKGGNELYAGFTLSELREKLPVDKVKVQLTSVTENVNISIEYELDFTLEEENNTVYTPEDEFLDNLYGTLVLPENITNPDNLMYEFMVKTNAVEIAEIEPVSVMVDYYTEFNNIALPDTVYVNLSNGQRKAIGVTWSSDGYNPDPAELTEDNPVVFNLTGTLCNIPLYINHYDTDIPQLTITLVLPRVYTITDISPVRIPETGTKKINLGTEIPDINELLETHSATVTLENLKGVTTTKDITFTLREEDNTHYDAMSEEEFELTAYLNLPEGIENPDNKQLIISVRPTKYTIRTTVSARVNDIAKGTPFAEIAMPEKVTVNYTDTETKQGEVPVASWDGSKYNPEKIGNQAIKGTFPAPLPAYVTNPNNRTPSAIVNVVDQTTTILSAKQVTETSPFSALKRSIRKAITQTEEIDGYIERKYQVELLHEDGSITTEIISIFDEAEEN